MNLKTEVHKAINDHDLLTIEEIEDLFEKYEEYRQTNVYDIEIENAFNILEDILEDKINKFKRVA